MELKYFSGAGNLFTAIDNRNYKLEKSYFSKNALYLTSENHKLPNGTEGIIVLNPVEKNEFDFEVWFFNPDGSSGMMCGNGGRCAINFAHRQNYLKYHNSIKDLNENNSSYSANFIMNGRIYSGFVDGENTGIFFPPPIEISDIIELKIEDKIFIGRYVNIGTDHFVVEVEDVLFEDVESNGKKIRFSSNFQPRGVNVNFYSKQSQNNLIIRTYERGVEKETGACGTGAISTAIVHNINNKTEKKINLLPTSKSPLTVELFFDSENNINKILLSGAVQEI